MDPYRKPEERPEYPVEPATSDNQYQYFELLRQRILNSQNLPYFWDPFVRRPVRK